MNNKLKFAWPMLAILVGATAAWTYQDPQRGAVRDPAKDEAPEPRSSAAPMPNLPGAESEPTNASTLTGKILETIAVPNYVYLKLSASSGATGSADSVWAAVPTTAVSVGQTVTVNGAQRMDNFTSSSLKRTFEVIYFGSLERPQADSALPVGHPKLSGDVGAIQGAEPGAVQPGSPLPAGHPPIGSDGSGTTDAANGSASPHANMGVPSGLSAEGMPNPHANSNSAGDAVPVGKVPRAEGDLGHAIAELFKQRKSLSGKRVRVRGVVVKSTSGVLNRTFLHLRDGTGSAAASDHDLTITTEQEATVGKTVVCEGVLTLDRDFGAGYAYPVIIENAKVVNE